MCIVLHCVIYIVLRYFVAASISGSKNESSANFSPRNNKVNVHYWILEEVAGTSN